MRIKELVVTFDLTVQPKQYNAMKVGLTIPVEMDEEDVKDAVTLEDRLVKLQDYARDAVLREIHKATEQVYGKAVADYVVSQAQE